MTEDIGAQTAQIQSATREAVGTIHGITARIGEISTIGTTVASAIEQQGSATAGIARNVQKTAANSQEVSTHIAGVSQAVTKAAEDTGMVLTAAGELAAEATRLRSEVDSFVAAVRAA